MYEINQRVKKMRRSHLYTQEQLAKLLNFKTSTYSQMERSGQIHAETLIKISEILDVDIRYFLYGEDFFENKEEIVAESPEPPQPPKPQDIFELLETNERNLIITYRNLNTKEKQEAYSLFMENFNLNTLHRKKREEKQKKRTERESKTN